jgi:FkbH-like protein
MGPGFSRAGISGAVVHVLTAFQGSWMYGLKGQIVQVCADFMSYPMKWLPEIEDFQRTLASALCIDAPQARIERLASLAGYRLGILETLQLDRALGRVGSELDGFPSLRLAIIGSAALNHLAPGIRVAGLRHRLILDVQTGNYGQYCQEVLAPTSFLTDFAPNVVVLSITVRDAIGNVALTASEPEVTATLAKAVTELRELWRRIKTSIKASVIQQSFLDHSLPVFGSFDRSVPAAPSRLVSRLNELVTDAANLDGVSLLDIAGQAQRDGIDAWLDVRRWLQAKQEVKPEAAALYGELLARVISAQRGGSRKCLVLDLDGTLWGGVVGDDGIGGIVLGAGSAQGEAHLALQNYARQLKERGIILAVCSKNDLATAEAVFRDHSEMLLKRSDIAVFAANWNNKAANLKDIAAKLNIGVDSLVLVDDNPVERAYIREALPMVAVPELPEDPAEYASTLAQAGYFEAVGFTQEDRVRTELYIKDIERNALMSESASIDEFLRGLNMSLVHGPFANNDLTRVTQLINKTNQFNTTTRRYSAEEIADRASAPNYISLQFRLRDRYGDNGVVSTIILSPNGQEATAFEVESWVMSCRVFGRELESEVMNITVEAARRRNAQTLIANYVPTSKNVVIKDLYGNLGFNLIGGSQGREGLTRWQLDIAQYSPRQTHIARTSP